MVVVLTYPLGQFRPRNSVSMFCFFFESQLFFCNANGFLCTGSADANTEGEVLI